MNFIRAEDDFFAADNMKKYEDEYLLTPEEDEFLSGYIAA